MAEEAKSLLVINEVCPPEQVMPCALELARMLAAKPALLRRYTRTALTIKRKRQLDEGLGYGLASEGLNVISSMPTTSLWCIVTSECADLIAPRSVSFL